MTRIQLATGFLEVDVDFPITVSFNDILKRGQRSGGFSQSIEVQGNANNQTLLGLYFDVDLENDTFNRNIKTECSIIQNDVEVFNGFIQLLEIKRINKGRSNNQQKITYSVFVFDEVANFFNSMADFELTDLSFPEFNHTFNRAEIISSWQDSQEGYCYPPFAKQDNVYTLRDFKPALFEYEYFKKIFAVHGYTFEFTQFDASTLRMDRRIVPYNGKGQNPQLSAVLQNQYKVIGEQETYDELIAQTMPFGYLPSPTNIYPSALQSYASTQQRIELNILQDTQAQWDTSADELVNLAGAERTFTFLSNYSVTTRCRAYDDTNTLLSGFVVQKTAFFSRVELYCSLVIQSTTTPSKVLILDVGTPIDVWDSITQTFTGGAGGWVDLGTTQIASTGQLGLMDANETFVVTPLIFARAYYNNNDVVVSPVGTTPFTWPWSTPQSYNEEMGYKIRDTGTNNVRLEFDIEINDLTFQAIPNIEELISGSVVDISAFIPQKIKQKDFISTIIKTYNLLLEPDPNNEQNIIISTRDAYLDAGVEWDWTQKLAQDIENNITFLSNDINRVQVYTYKEDKDTLNTAYQTQIKEVYGEAQLTLDNQYKRGEDVNQLIYSPTPNIQSAIGLTLPSINGIDPDMNPRVLLNNGLVPCNTMMLYDSLLPDTTAQNVVETLHTSMFDNDQTPNFSICFDSPKYLFHPTQQGQTTNYLYFLHHKREVTNLNNGKMFVGYFDLTEVDFQRVARQLNWKIWIKDNGWFYINKVDKYNAGKRTLTRVELITLDDESDLKLPTVIGTGTLPNSTIVTNDFLLQVNQSTNIIMSPNTRIQGGYNFVTMPDVTIMGNRNTVLSPNVRVMGNNNRCEAGSAGSIVLSDDAVVSQRSTVVGNRNVNQDVITLDLESTLTITFVAAFNFIIESVTFLTTSTTETIEVNTVPYTFGVKILIGQMVEVTVLANTTINLNIYR
jgi:hypothetical protein